MDRAGRQYESLITIPEDRSESIGLLKGLKISFANQVYNEPEAIGSYLSSCLQFAGIVDEVYIINHRSSDNTLEVIKSFESQYAKAGISLRWKTEPRDFSKNFTIADLFGDAVKECANEIVFRHDADFIFGSGYLKTMESAVKFLSVETVYACGYEIPVVSKSVKFEENKVVEHGSCRMHVSVPRVFKRTKTRCIQNHVGGKFEWFYPIYKECSKWVNLPHFRESVLSVDIKDQSRQEIRRTMNTFMLDVCEGKASGNWLDSENLRKEKVFSDREEGRRIDIDGERYE